MKMMRHNVLIDSGKLVSANSSQIIETPDDWKRINSRGTILEVGPDCRMITKEMIGKECVIGQVRHEDYRINPRGAEKFGLKPHWHFICPEDKVQVVLEQ